MNYTSKNHLPQWAESDRILMDDFNAAMRNIENGISSAQSAADRAQTTADRAQTAASSAQTAAGNAFSPSLKPYFAQQYTTRGRDTYIHVGFRPSFLIISGMRAVVTSTDTSEYDRWSCATAGYTLTERVRFEDDGFTVLARSSEGAFPDLCEKDRAYDFIAFR